MLQAVRTTTQPRVLVVDDDASLRRVVGDYLGEHGLQVDLAAGRAEMMRLMQGVEHSVVILDLKLGDTDGLDLLRELRMTSNLPVVIITGHRSAEIDRVVALEREAIRASQSPASAGPRVLTFAGWTLDRRLRQLRNPAGEVVSLSNGEYNLLSAFLDAPQRPLSREHLMQATRVHEDVFDRSIDVQILRLRRKLDTDPSHPSMIRTERSVGYVFSVPVEPA